MTATETQNFPPVLLEAIHASVPVGFSFITNSRPIQKLPEFEQPCDGMIAVISFIGDYSWSFTLVVPKPSVLSFCQAFTGFEFPYTSPDMGDVVGELANVLAGEITAQLYARRVEAKMSLPTVARGSDVELILPEGTPAARLQYASDQGPFAFKLTLAKPSKSWARRAGVATA